MNKKAAVMAIGILGIAPSFVGALLPKDMATSGCGWSSSSAMEAFLSGLMLPTGHPTSGRPRSSPGWPKALDPDHPLATSVLDRTQTEDVHAMARSKAYGHTVDYWKALQLHSGETDGDCKRSLAYPLYSN